MRGCRLARLHSCRNLVERVRAYEELCISLLRTALEFTNSRVREVVCGDDTAITACVGLRAAALRHRARLTFILKRLGNQVEMWTFESGQ